MNSKQKKKLSFVCFLIVLLAVAAAFVLYALKKNINLYYTPTQARAEKLAPTQTLRLGGFVATHSLDINTQTLVVNFNITDYKTQIPVHYQGELPNLFREKQGVVITGHFDANGSFTATEILAKHDENYIPKPVKELLAQQGVADAR
ncbi:MAG: cytochrome c maturation protein CcmE [Gammaproteobacteria bacterium]|nr:cytochrome c maturation protein CcmE [Gammaproteobacteria bacterium]